MIERKLLAQNKTELGIQDFIKGMLRNALVSDIKINKTPLGEKITVHCARPGLIVGRKGGNIKLISQELKTNFKLENPQLEIVEVKNKFTDANIVASMISNSLHQYGSVRFKGIAHKMISSVMGSGAMGIEIRLSGKIPSARSRTWRFYAGYLKKNGDVAVSQVDMARDNANLKSGTIGIVVKIMKSDVVLPDKMTFTIQEEEIPQQEEEKKEEKIEKKEKKTVKKTKDEKKVEPKAEPAKEEVKEETIEETTPEVTEEETKTEEKVEEQPAEEVKETTEAESKVEEQ